MADYKANADWKIIDRGEWRHAISPQRLQTLDVVRGDGVVAMFFNNTGILDDTTTIVVLNYGEPTISIVKSFDNLRTDVLITDELTEKYGTEENPLPPWAVGVAAFWGEDSPEAWVRSRDQLKPVIQDFQKMLWKRAEAVGNSPHVGDILFTAIGFPDTSELDNDGKVDVFTMVENKNAMFSISVKHPDDPTQEFGFPESKLKIVTEKLEPQPELWTIEREQERALLFA